jgi:hypothetical protein
MTAVVHWCSTTASERRHFSPNCRLDVAPQLGELRCLLSLLSTLPVPKMLVLPHLLHQSAGTNRAAARAVRAVITQRTRSAVRRGVGLPGRLGRVGVGQVPRATRPFGLR